jgi:hypothetical protein
MIVSQEFRYKITVKCPKCGYIKTAYARVDPNNLNVEVKHAVESASKTHSHGRRHAVDWLIDTTHVPQR